MSQRPAATTVNATAVVVLLVLVLALLACATVPVWAAGESAPVDLTFWHGFNAHEIDALKDVIQERFLSKHAEVRLRIVPGVAPEQILTRIVGGDPPDVAVLWDAYPLGAWVHNGLVQPLDAWVRRDGVDLNAFVPVGLEMLTFDGNLYGLPFELFNFGLYYNRRLYAEAGLDDSRAPGSIEELETVSLKLTVREPDGRIRRLGFLPNNAVVQLMLAFGGRFYDPVARRVLAAQAPNVEALKWAAQLVQKLGPAAVNQFLQNSVPGSLTSSNPFYTERLATVVDGVWQVAFISRYAPQVDFGVGPIPSPAAKPQAQGSNLVGCNPVVIPVGVKHPQEAWEFARWLATDPEVARILSAKIYNIPHLRSVFTTFTSDPRLRAFAYLSVGRNATYMPALPISLNYTEELVAAASRALSLDVTPEAALTEVAERLQKEVDKAYAKATGRK